MFACCRALRKSRKPGPKQITPNQDMHLCLYKIGCASACNRVLSDWCFEHRVCHCFSPAQHGRTVALLAQWLPRRQPEQPGTSPNLIPWVPGCWDKAPAVRSNYVWLKTKCRVEGHSCQKHDAPQACLFEGIHYVVPLSVGRVPHVDHAQPCLPLQPIE